ncbi:hypothetical protein [Anabaena sp. CCY 9614]|uniref:hypothetical protein n=1 Tax=Anabaena sp. CCY 9614 TaxID=3103869 RepID=UPI0039C7108A
MLIERVWRWRAIARRYGNTCQKFTCEWKVSQRERLSRSNLTLMSNRKQTSMLSP